MASSDPGDRRGLLPGASLPLGYRPTRERDPYSLGVSMDEVTPQALLRDLHRVVREFRVDRMDLEQLPAIDFGAAGALSETHTLMSTRYALDLKTLVDGPRQRQESVDVREKPIRKALRVPYVPDR